MKKTLALLLLFLGAAVCAQAQSTTVSGQVTDTGAQSWDNGRYSFQFVPNPQFPNIAQYTWTGGTLPQTVSGPLGASGFYTTSVPSNSAISPQGSKWILSVCPLATSSCFISANTTITGGTQTLNVTPFAIAINLTTPPGSFTRAYSDAEIVSAVIGAQYYNVTTQKERVCQAVSGQTCTTWVDLGGTAGSVGPSTTFASAYFNSPTTLSGISAPTVNGSYLCGYNVSASVAVAPTCEQTGLSARSATGATDTILFTDNNSSVEYQGAVSVATSLPTPTTLTNPSFFTALENLTTGVGTSVTVTPTTFTINGAATLVITQNQICLIKVDPALATNWLASCTGGGAAAFPRLDQVLDPTVDKTFAMGGHLVSFSNGSMALNTGALGGTPQPGSFLVGSSAYLDTNQGPLWQFEQTLTADGAYGGFETQVKYSPVVSQAASTFFAHGLDSFYTSAQPINRYVGVDASLLIEGGSAVATAEGITAHVLSQGAGTAITDANTIHIIGLSGAGGTITNNRGLLVDDLIGGSNNWAIKTGLGKVQFGNIATGSLTYNPAFDGAINKASDIRLRGLDGTLMYELEAGNGPAVPPTYFQRIGPPNTASLTGNFPSTEGSRVDLFTGADGAGAVAAQSIFLHHDFCSSTNGSGCYGNQVNLSLDVADGTNAFGTKEAIGYNAIITNSVNNGASIGAKLDVACTGTPCTADAIAIQNGAIKLNTSAGTSGQVLTSAGVNAIPTWTTPTAVPVAVTNFPSNVGTDTKTSQVAAIGSTTLLTTGGSNAAYMAVVTLNCDTTSAAATVNVTLGWTDPGSQAQTQSLGSAIVCTALGSNSMGGFTFPFRAKASTTITYSTSIVNTPTYDISVVIYKVTAN